MMECGYSKLLLMDQLGVLKRSSGCSPSNFVEGQKMSKELFNSEISEQTVLESNKEISRIEVRELKLIEETDSNLMDTPVFLRSVKDKDVQCSDQNIKMTVNSGGLSKDIKHNNLLIDNINVDHVTTLKETEVKTAEFNSSNLKISVEKVELDEREKEKNEKDHFICEKDSMENAVDSKDFNSETEILENMDGREDYECMMRDDDEKEGSDGKTEILEKEDASTEKWSIKKQNNDKSRKDNNKFVQNGQAETKEENNLDQEHPKLSLSTTRNNCAADFETSSDGPHKILSDLVENWGQFCEVFPSLSGFSEPFTWESIPVETHSELSSSSDGNENELSLEDRKNAQFSASNFNILASVYAVSKISSEKCVSQNLAQSLQEAKQQELMKNLCNEMNGLKCLKRAVKSSPLSMDNRYYHMEAQSVGTTLLKHKFSFVKMKPKIRKVCGRRYSFRKGKNSRNSQMMKRKFYTETIQGHDKGKSRRSHFGNGWNFKHFNRKRAHRKCSKMELRKRDRKLMARHPMCKLLNRRPICDEKMPPKFKVQDFENTDMGQEKSINSCKWKCRGCTGGDNGKSSKKSNSSCESASGSSARRTCSLRGSGSSGHSGGSEGDDDDKDEDGNNRRDKSKMYAGISGHAEVKYENNLKAKSRPANEERDKKDTSYPQVAGPSLPSPNLDAKTIHNRQHVEKASLCETPSPAVVSVSPSHGALSIETFLEILGSIVGGKPSLDLTSPKGRTLNKCLTVLLHQVDLALLSNNETIKCQTCLLLASLMQHLANTQCNDAEGACTLCSQINVLVKMHVELCLREKRNKKHTRTDLCFKVCKASEWNITTLTENRWKLKVKKNLSKILGNSSPLDDDNQESQPKAGTQMASGASGGHKLPSISEGLPEHYSFHLMENVSSPFSSGTPHFSPSHLQPNESLPEAVLPFQNESSTTQKRRTSSSSVPGTPKAERNPTAAIPNNVIEEGTLPVTGGNIPLNPTSFDRRQEDDDRYRTQPVYGGEAYRFRSVSDEHVHDVFQYFSVANRPVGFKGVGEVVFAFPAFLHTVARYWSRKREELENNKIKYKQKREEGVILPENKQKFRILKTRYQINMQWRILTSLGCGMFGKCFLAEDMETEFKFCVKKLDLTSFVEEELRLWSEMEHSHIVQLYGAIRHGRKVFIFSEFIGGGSLAECIIEQKALGCRLSHWHAIHIFRQLLQVLSYLQSKNILHEDLKAENILLRSNSTHITVTDFGTSVRLQNPKEMQDKSPTGTPNHWSPEKASMEGHGFPSDLWAAVCVLVHMLSAEQPWHKYMERAAILNFIIYDRPPPMDDIPENVRDTVKDMIAQGFNKNPKQRPSIQELLKHQAFEILDQGTPDTYYSNLLPVSCSSGSSGTSKITDSKVGALQPFVKNKETDPEVLYSISITKRPCQESEKRPFHESGNNVSSICSEQLDDSTSLGSENYRRTVQDYQAIPTPPNQAFTPVTSRDLFPSTSTATSAEMAAAQSHSPSKLGMAQQLPRICEEASPRLQEEDSSSLIPALNKLLLSDSDEDGSRTISIRSFVTDCYPGQMTFPSNESNQPKLEIYQPDSILADDAIPKLSIFDVSLNSSSSGKGTFIPTMTGDFRSQGCHQDDPLHSSESEKIDSGDLFGPGPDVDSDSRSNLKQRRLRDVRLNISNSTDDAQDSGLLLPDFTFPTNAVASQGSGSMTSHTAGSSASPFSWQETGQMMEQLSRSSDNAEMQMMLNSLEKEGPNRTVLVSEEENTSSQALLNRILGDDHERADRVFRMEFLNAKGVLLFPYESSECFVKWDTIITNFRTKIYQSYKSKHFYLQHLDGRLMEFYEECRVNKVKIIFLDKCTAECWCEKRYFY